MKLFTSKREQRLWFWAVATIIAIYSSIGIAQPLAGTLRERGLLEISFGIAMLLVIGAILTQRVKMRAGWGELGVWLGIIGVYLLVLVRMEIPEERTHLIEYSVLAAFIFEALTERVRNKHLILFPAAIAVFMSAALGFIDEAIQFFLPNRVFDWRDVGFNALASLMAVFASLALSWMKKRYASSKEKRN